MRLRRSQAPGNSTRCDAIRLFRRSSPTRSGACSRAWPAGILTRPEIDQEVGGTRPVDFASDLARLEELLALVTTRTPRVDWQVHPVFGRMSEAAWLRWTWLHVDHHLRQFGA